MFPKKLIVVTFLLILAVTTSAYAAPPAEVREVEVTREVQVTVEVTPEAIENQEQAEEPGEETTVQQEEAPTLSTAKVVSALSNQPGRAIVTARGNHFVVDSVPPLDGPNEEMNPLDAILGALATCGTFVYEAAAQEMDIPVKGISTTVQGDFNAAGVKDGSVNPRIQALRVHMNVDGPSDEQLAALAKEFQARCPIYTTLSRAADITITHNDEAMSAAAVEVIMLPNGQMHEKKLATATTISTLANQFGRAIVTARGNHFVIDSVPPLNGPNEERNPLDLLLASLATCGTFVYEAAAQELDMPLESIATTVEGDFNPAGVKDGSVNPRLQAFRVNMAVSGVTDEQADELSEQFQARCPIYTTLSRSAPVEIANNVQ